MLRTRNVTVHHSSERLRKMANCKHCDRYFTQNARGTKIYCSPACRTAASRERNSEQPDYRGLRPHQKAIKTKLGQERVRECKHCHMYFPQNGLQHNKKFCNNACKMAYHRRYDYYGTYAPKQPAQPAQKSAPVPVVYNEQEAIRNAWIEAVEA